MNGFPVQQYWFAVSKFGLIQFLGCQTFRLNDGVYVLWTYGELAGYQTSIPSVAFQSVDKSSEVSSGDSSFLCARYLASMYAGCG